METVFWVFTAVLVGLRTWVEIRRVLQERRSRRIQEEELARAEEDARLYPPPPYDPVAAEDDRIKMLAAGWTEEAPGIYTFPAHPAEQARLLEALRDRCHYVRQLRCKSTSAP